MKARRMKAGDILFRKGEALQALRDVKVVALDKTGTLTQNKMEFKKCQVGSDTYGNLTD